MKILKKNSKSIRLVGISKYTNSVLNEVFMGEFYYMPIGPISEETLDKGICAQLSGSQKIIIELSHNSEFSNEDTIRISTGHDWPPYDYDEAITVMVKPYPRSFKIAVAFFNKKLEKHTVFNI